MPDPMSNVEIEDVLSSIRRLVSDDVRSVETRTRGTDMPRERAPAAAPVDDSAAVPASPPSVPEDSVAQAASSDATEPGAMSSGGVDAQDEIPDAPDLNGADELESRAALVLTAAQRVSEPPAKSNVRRWTSAANDATRPSDESARPSANHPGATSLEQTISELEAAVAGIDGEFELDWGSQPDGQETPQDLEAVFRDPSLRDRVTLEAAAASFAVTDDADDAVSDDASAATAFHDTEMVRADAELEAAQHDGAEAARDAQDEAQDAMQPAAEDVIDAERNLGSDDPVAPVDDALDMPITGNASTLTFGPAHDLAAATAASLAALNAATQLASAVPAAVLPRRLHFGARADEAAAELTMPAPVEDAERVAEALAAETAIQATVETAAEATSGIDDAGEAVPADLTGDDSAKAETAPAADPAHPIQRHPVIVRNSMGDADDAVLAAAQPADLPGVGDTEAAEAENLFQKSPDREIDLEALRDLVAEIIRQELQGVLGERITRNVRKLVRREINRVLETRPLE